MGSRKIFGLGLILAMALVTLVPFAFVHVFQHDVVDVVTPVDARATDMAQQADRQGVVAARAAPRAPDVALPDVALPDVRKSLVYFKFDRRLI